MSTTKEMSEPTSGDELAEGKPPTVGPAQLAIHFIKSSNFRVIHGSGVWYGGDAQQNLHITFFNERNPIPRTIVLNVTPEGMVANEDLSKRDAKEGVVREMEVDIIMSLPAAIEFHKTLGENLKVMQENLRSLQRAGKHE